MTIDMLEWCINLVGFIRSVDLFSDVKFSGERVVWIWIGIVCVFLLLLMRCKLSDT